MDSITRIEKYLSEIENGGKDVPVPVTRIEHYLYEIAQGGGGGGASSADDVSYDNTTSGISATNVQDAIDEIAQGSSPVDVVPDLVISGTFSENLNDTAFEGFTYAFKNGLTIEDIIDKIEDKGKIDIKSNIYRPRDDGEGNVLLKEYASLSCDQSTIMVSTVPAVASQIVELNGDSRGTSKNAVVLPLCGGAAFWDVEAKSGGGYELKIFAKKMLIYENADGVLSYIINAYIPI